MKNVMFTIHTTTKTIKELLSNNKQFLIPAYQRPYSWRTEHCRRLWDDLYDFAFLGAWNEDIDDDEKFYPLGDIMFYPNKNNQNEIVDGQQRIITLTLLLRAFYEHFQKQNNERTQNILKDIEHCIWLTDELGFSDLNHLKVVSDFLERSDDELFKNILTTGATSKGAKDNFSRNYNFFKNAIRDYYNNEFILFPARILNNCFVRQGEAPSQGMAVKFFITINNRGLPLNTPQIFYIELFKNSSDKGDSEKFKFVSDWDRLTRISKDIFPRRTNISPMESLLMCYTKAFNERRKIQSIKKFFEKDNHVKLLADNFIPDLFALTGFWQDVYEQNKMRFSEEVLRKIYTVLRITNAHPMLALSGLFFYLRERNELYNQELINELLGKYTAFLFACAIQGDATSTMLSFGVPNDWKQLNEKPDDIFKEHKISKTSVEFLFRNFSEARNKIFIRQAVLSYWFFKEKTQELLSPKDKFSIEHIVARDMTNFQKFQEPDLIESLGNMAFLENRINTRAGNNSFAVKKQCYLGFTDKDKHSPGTVNRELQHIAQKLDFAETDVRNRNEKMLQAILDLLSKYNLLR